MSATSLLFVCFLAPSEVGLTVMVISCVEHSDLHLFLVSLARVSFKLSLSSLLDRRSLNYFVLLK